MTMKKQVYKCEICGNIVEVLHEGPGALVCCGKEMRLFVENTSDGAKEKHVPVIEKTETGFKVKVGGAPHPMEEKHFIEWLELTADGRVFREFLKPGQAAEASFCLCFEPAEVSVRGYCNLHGLWKTDFK
ncbi:MAG: desulfoferrodoxin [Elusimicrobia bacterium]|nr:desulfoferrodoxin [Elusimicrobiota bacterium]